MSISNKVDSYGWADTAPLSHGYLGYEIINILKQVNAQRVLDLGCGNGVLCHSMSEAGFDCVGCDADREGVEHARNKNQDLTFIELGVYDEPEQLGLKEFDAVVSAEVVEHLFKPRFLPKFANAVLKEGGYLIITTPYHGYLKNLMLSLLDKWDVHHTVLWEGGHIKFWSYKTLKQLVESEGFVVESFKGVGRFPLMWKSMIIIARKK